jgi:hypothetical protein
MQPKMQKLCRSYAAQNGAQNGAQNAEVMHKSIISSSFDRSKFPIRPGLRWREVSISIAIRSIEFPDTANLIV